MIEATFRVNPRMSSANKVINDVNVNAKIRNVFYKDFR